MRSSPTLTFSPSDLCLDAGWIVHQHASPGETFKNFTQISYLKKRNNWLILPSIIQAPVESSCRPTSKASLSVSDLDVVKQLRYCTMRWDDQTILVSVTTSSHEGVFQKGAYWDVTHHAWVCVSEQDGVAVQQRPVTSALWWLRESRRYFSNTIQGIKS